MIKLNLGSGDKIIKGYFNVDLYSEKPWTIIDDITTLEKTIESLGLDHRKVDEIYSSHSLMCVPESRLLSTLKLWRRLLKKGGELIIETTDLDKQIREYNKDHFANSEIVVRSLFGDGVRDGEGLKYQFNSYLLGTWLERAGFKHITVISQPKHSKHKEEFNLTMRAVK